MESKAPSCGRVCASRMRACRIPRIKSECKICCTTQCLPGTTIDRTRRDNCSKRLSNSIPSRPPHFANSANSSWLQAIFLQGSHHLKQAAQLRPDDSTAAFELGEAMAKSGDLAGARDALEASLKLLPSQIPARLLLGHVYLQLKDVKNAEDQFEAALLVDSENTGGRMGLAEAQIAAIEFRRRVA